MKLQVFFFIIINIVDVFGVDLHLFTKSNPENSYKLTLDKSGQNLPINFTNPVKLLIHGWENDNNEDWLSEMRRSYLAVARVNYDVIVADWGEISKDLLYPVVVARLHNVADQISHYIEILEHTMSFDVDNLHIVGHSLGAHVAGFVGSHFHGTIRRITALDPAGPWFLSGVPDEYRIDRSDAKFVDVIHTCAGVAGLRMPCGHVDYYVNRGTCDQPGCLMPGMNIPCSHSRAYWLMIESIKYPKAFKVKFQYCNINGKVGECQPRVPMYMGEGARKKIIGLFEVSTNDKSPYGKNYINNI